MRAIVRTRTIAHDTGAGTAAEPRRDARVLACGTHRTRVSEMRSAALRVAARRASMTGTAQRRPVAAREWEAGEGTGTGLRS